jgi:uncharacterized protein (DUF39 family)
LLKEQYAAATNLVDFKKEEELKVVDVVTTATGGTG